MVYSRISMEQKQSHPSVEILPPKDRCEICKDYLEVKVDRPNLTVVVTCKICKKYSVIKAGKVVVDEEPLP